MRLSVSYEKRLLTLLIVLDRHVQYYTRPGSHFCVYVRATDFEVLRIYAGL